MRMNCDKAKELIVFWGRILPSYNNQRENHRERYIYQVDGSDIKQ